jgi:NAD(P)-dependent dehydrogenase (short-subunit alcohol dehydrogenase family)
MKVIVITGSTKGIGYGLADAFLQQGCAVFISSRSEKNVQEATGRLSEKHGTDRVRGGAADVAIYDSVRGLWDSALAQFGRIDIWINNAGQSHPQMNFWEQDAETVKSVVDTNLLGAMNGSKVALAGMMSQQHGMLYNMLGLGSNGMKVKGFALYGSTKYAVKYLTSSLVGEVKHTPIKVGYISPGMVATDLLLGDFRKHPEGFERMKRVFNILADRVETVTPWLAQQVLANDRNDKHIAWLTKPKIAWRFLSSPFYKRNIIV